MFTRTSLCYITHTLNTHFIWGAAVTRLPDMGRGPQAPHNKTASGHVLAVKSTESFHENASLMVLMNPRFVFSYRYLGMFQKV